MQRLLLVLVLILSFLWSGWNTAAAASDAFKVVINKQELSIKAPIPSPQLVNSRVYVPLRVISENLGSQVKWDQANYQVLITSPGKTEVSAPNRTIIDKNVRIVVDGRPLVLEASLGQPFIVAPGYTMVPLRAVAVALNCAVAWEAATRIARVDSVIEPITNSNPPIENPPSSTPTTPIVTPATPAEVPTNPPVASSSSLLEELAAYSTNLKLLNGTVINSASLQGRQEAEFTADQISQFNKLLAEIKKYPRTISLPAGQQIDTYNLAIMGKSVATAAQLKAWAEANASRIQQAKNLPLVPVPDLAALYLRIGEEYGIRGDLAFCQAAKETGYWQFSGQVRPEQNNYCGLNAIGSPLTGNESLGGADPKLVSFKAGTHGAWFATPEAGVQAHIQHLYAYATTSPLPAGTVIADPRFKLVSKGIAPTWTGLNARWAVPGTTYGQSIIQDYWVKALSAN